MNDDPDPALEWLGLIVQVIVVLAAAASITLIILIVAGV